MAELGIPYELVTPAGTALFNQRGVAEYLRFTSVEGMDLAVLPRELQGLGGRDGVAPLPNVFREALFPAFAGDVVATSLTARRQKHDELRSRIASITNADGTLKWTPSGASMRQRTVRTYEGPFIRQGEKLDPFQFTLIAADPLAYSTVEQTSADITANGPAVNVTNGGDAPTWPKIRIYGASTNPIVKNNTTGKRIELDYGGGLVIADGTYVEIDTRRSQVVLVSTGASQIGAFDPLVSEFFQLQVGVNAIEFDVTSPGVNSKVVVLHRDAYWG